MIIDLQNVMATVLTLHETKKRFEDFSTDVGSKLSINCFYGEKHPNPTIGFNISTYKMYQSVKPKCIVFEDAQAGIEAAINGGMKVIGLGESSVLCDADKVIPNFVGVKTTDLLRF